MTSLAQRMQIASAFVVFHRKHINDKTLTSLTIGWQEDLDIHLSNNGNAAKALAFAVPVLDKPTVELSETSGDAVHVYLHGAYAGLKVKATSIAKGADAERLLALEGWTGHRLQLSVDAFLELAALPEIER